MANSVKECVQTSLQYKRQVTVSESKRKQAEKKKNYETKKQSHMIDTHFACCQINIFFVASNTIFTSFLFLAYVCRKKRRRKQVIEMTAKRATYDENRTYHVLFIRIPMKVDNVTRQQLLCYSLCLFASIPHIYGVMKTLGSFTHSLTQFIFDQTNALNSRFFFSLHC